jgi:hypothetical protein
VDDSNPFRPRKRLQEGMGPRDRHGKVTPSLMDLKVGGPGRWGMRGFLRVLGEHPTQEKYTQGNQESK